MLEEGKARRLTCFMLGLKMAVVAWWYEAKETVQLDLDRKLRAGNKGAAKTAGVSLMTCGSILHKDGSNGLVAREKRKYTHADFLHL